MTRLPPCSAVRHALARATFWSSLAALAWTQVGYGAFLAGLRRVRGPGSNPAVVAGDDLPTVALIVAAYAEQDVIAAKVANALALDWPREKLQLVVAVDGGAEPGADATAERARAAGADVVLALPRTGKVRAQDAAVAASRGELLAFTDANAAWEPGALRRGVRSGLRPAVDRDDHLEPLARPVERERVRHLGGDHLLLAIGGHDQRDPRQDRAVRRRGAVRCARGPQQGQQQRIADLRPGDQRGGDPQQGTCHPARHADRTPSPTRIVYE